MNSYKRRNNKTYINQKVILPKIKSHYILKDVYNHLQKRKLMKIIKYNKNLQKKMNISINDYKHYKKIGIEIIPSPIKYGKFINYDEKYKSHFHIYFNNETEEIKRNYFDKGEKINKIKIIIDPKVNTFFELFKNCECIYSINFTHFNVNNINNMSHMFYGCSFLNKIIFTNFNTDKVTDMSCMFYECSSLKSLNPSKFNTYRVTKMNDMFFNCKSLKELNITNFNTNYVTDMTGMFFGCQLLKELNLSNFNTNKVNSMASMFYYCLNLRKLNIENFDTRKVNCMVTMFTRCKSLKEMKFSKTNFIVKNKKDLIFMFYESSDYLNKIEKILNN